MNSVQQITSRTGNTGPETPLSTGPFLLPIIAGLQQVWSWVAMTLVIAASGALPPALPLNCVLPILVGWIAGAWGIPLSDVWYGETGVRFRTWTGVKRFVPWDQFGHVRMRWYHWYYRSIVFHVGHGATEERYYLIAPTKGNYGRDPRDIFGDLATAAPGSIVVRGRRSSIRAVARALAWTVTAGLAGLLVSVTLWSGDWRAVAVSTTAGTTATLIAALIGRYDAVELTDVLDGSADFPRAYRDWIHALTDVARR